MTIKTIPSAALRPGVYIHDLRCAWMDHPFARNRFAIRDWETTQAIRDAGIGQVVIDTDKGLDPTQDASPSGRTAETPTTPADTGPEEITPDANMAQPVSVYQERRDALHIQREATQTITEMMQEVRLGKPVETGRVSDVVDAMIDSVFRNQDALLSLGLIRNKDRYTFEHSVSVAVLAVAMARSMEFDRETLSQIGVGALLHDIGKARTPLTILNKPGKLTDDEYAVMKKHVVHSHRILSEAPGITPVVLATAVEHHERFDGSGYPRGLQGEEISLFGRMLAICDVYDAITATRCYREGREPGWVLKQMLDWAGSHFDPPLVHQFIRCVGIYPVGTLVGMKSGRLGVIIKPGKKGLLYPVIRLFFDTRSRTFIEPRELDLSDPDAIGTDSIARYESPGRWGVQPHRFID